MEDNLKIPQKIKSRITKSSSSPTSVYSIHPKGLKHGSQKGICTSVFIISLLIIPNVETT